MARAALRLSLTDLADLSGVNERTIRRCESVDGPPPVADHTIICIGEALIKAGVRFTEGRGRTWGPGCTLDWNPEKGPRTQVQEMIRLEGDPEVGGPKLDWPPLPPRPKRKR